MNGIHSQLVLLLKNKEQFGYIFEVLEHGLREFTVSSESKTKKIKKVKLIEALVCEIYHKQRGYF